MTASIVKDLFLGRLDPAVLQPYPFLDGDEIELLAVVREAIARFAADKIDAHAIDEAHGISAEVIEGLAELGLFGLRVPEEFGGLELNASQYVRVGVDLAMYDGATAILSGGHSTIGIKALLLYGSPEQKKRYLPQLAVGDMKAAFALSEAGAGSDAQSLKLTATRRDDDSYVLNGNKLWITNGGFADLITVFARTPDHPREDGRPSISCFLVERAMGFVPGPEEEKLGLRGSSTVPLVFEDVVVPAENLVGTPGDGFRMALEILNAGRTGLAGNCLGAGRFLLAESTRYCEERRQFGKPIAEFELIREKLGRCAQDLHALECMIFLTTGLMDKAERDGEHLDLALESALCKVFGTETLWMVVNDGVQCAGGNGFTTDYPFERMLRDARVNMIFEGTNEILRLMVGSHGAGAVAKALGTAVPTQSEYGRRLSGAEAPEPLKVPAGLRTEALALSMGVADLAQCAAAAVEAHGTKLRERQTVAAGLADIASALYAQLAILSRAQTVVDRDGAEASAGELLLAKSSCRRQSRRARAAVSALRDNDDVLLFETAAAVREWGGLPGERL
ncbi:MAG: acyl-CoA dehydrogenase family protein 9 [Pseudohongiellaceae bacterium]|jgi:acyl-CoA dehydrogenase family protein 9